MNAENMTNASVIAILVLPSLLLFHSRYLQPSSWLFNEFLLSR